MKVYSHRDGSVIRGLDVMEYTYSGKDMGERSITATIKSPYPLNIEIGDYVIIDMNDNIKVREAKYQGSIGMERFYLYNRPTNKKRARRNSVGDAFEETFVFYPRQYELGMVQMRDFITEDASAQNVIYTGFENVTFFGGAKALLDKIIACLNHAHKNGTISGAWNYELAPSVDETKNPALNQFTFAFNGNSVMEALQFLNKEEYCNTTFFINDRTIYVGAKRPYLCAVDDRKMMKDTPLTLRYGKTSHLSPNINYGGLFDLTRSEGSKSPITRLYAYGANRNLNRYYCSDRIASGRYVNKLMLPSFSIDGQTDYLDSPEGIEKFGIREGTKTFDDIYPSLRYITYGDLRKIKYVVKVRCNPIDSGKDLSLHSISDSDDKEVGAIAIAQCYKVIQSDINPGINILDEAWPDTPIAVCVHAAGKIVKTIIQTSEGKQGRFDSRLVVDKNGRYVRGAAFLVHNPNWADIDNKKYDAAERAKWFHRPTEPEDLEGLYPTNDAQDVANMHRITYEDTFWLTDVYKVEYEDKEHDIPLYDKQTHFDRDGYSAYCWARFNDKNQYPDSTLVNEVVYVEPIVLTDNSFNLHNGSYQSGFDIYIRDCGFQIDEQNDFGEMVHAIMGDVKVSFLDGMLGGREYKVQDFVNDSQFAVVPAYTEKGAVNDGTDSPISFFEPSDNNDSMIPTTAFKAGAMWRIRLIRAEGEVDEKDLGIIIPTKEICAKPGDHIVLLDIQMPDVYIHAAEERLRVEAQKYLDRVDAGDVSYSVSVDKVRINQIPQYALQMREGLNVRIADEDIEIGTDVRERHIFNSKGGVTTNVPSTVYTQDVLAGDYVYAVNSDVSSQSVISFWCMVHKDHINAFLSTKKVHVNVQGKESMDITFSSATSCDKEKYKWMSGKNFDEDAFLDDDYELFDVKLPKTQVIESDHYSVGYSISVNKQKTAELGDLLTICNNTLIEFEGDYYYEVEFALANKSTEDMKSIRLIAPDGTNYDIDEWKKEDVGDRIFVTFMLPASYNTSGAMKFGVVLTHKGEPDNTITLYRVTRSNIDSKQEKVDYADMVIESVTIKVNDNTRDDDDRIVDVAPEPIRDVQITIKPKTQSSAWAEITGALDSVANEQALQVQTIQSIVNSARKNYVNLMNLRRNIFDPDGTCTDTFVQTMMLQVGADSMNYMLDNTRVDVLGMRRNIEPLGNVSINGEIKFHADVLRHYVFTDSNNGGRWYVAPGHAELGEHEVYFVCIKAHRTNSNAEWVISPVQHAVNEENDWWYFNYGILTGTRGDDGYQDYVLMETRGNAYMYGDNLICGKISDIAKQSWFDLTTGNFALGERVVDGKTTYQFSYINGVLSISGIPTEDALRDVIQRLVTMEGEILERADLLPTSKWGEVEGVTVKNESAHFYFNENNTVKSCMVIDTPSIGDLLRLNINIQGDEQDSYDLLIQIIRKGLAKRYTIGTYRIVGPDDKHIKFEYINDQYSDIEFVALTALVHTEHSVLISSSFLSSSVKVPKYEYLTKALQNDTTIAGGLVSTSLIMLKDKNGVNAGVSGLQDDNVALWAGGSYAKAVNKNTPVLITKDGLGSKIGSFEVVDDKTVRVTNKQGSYVDIKIGDINGKDSGLSFYHHLGDQFVQRIKLSPDGVENLQDLIDKCINGPTQHIEIDKSGDSDERFRVSASKPVVKEAYGTLTFVPAETQNITIDSVQAAVDSSQIGATKVSGDGELIVFASYRMKIIDRTSNIILVERTNDVSEIKISVTEGHTIEIIVNNQAVLMTDSDREITVQYQESLMRDVSYHFEIGTYYTSIGRDGMFSFFASDSYFYYSRQTGFVVQIGNKTLKLKDDQVYLEGLTGSSGALKGSLYSENGYIKIK